MSRSRLYRDAIEAYRRGHDRVWETDRMRPIPSPPPSDEPDWSAPSSSRGRLEIPVSKTLDFHRGPDTWRSRETAGGQRARDD